MVNLHDPRIEPEHVAINVGDTVTWVGLGQDTANIVEGYMGEFKSPFLGEPPDTFSYTFKRPGIYAYRNYWYSGRSTNGLIGLPLFFGSITVLPWTNSPPPVTINTPLDGFHFGRTFVWSEWISILATVTNEPSQVAQVEFYAGTNLLGVATNPPYQLNWWTNAPVGSHVLTARAIGLDGSSAVSPPVTIEVEETPTVRFRNPRLLYGRLFVVDYVMRLCCNKIVGVSELGQGFIGYREEKSAHQSGTFITEIGTNQMRFYWTQPQT